MMSIMGGQDALSRLLDPDYLKGVEDKPSSTLREIRQEYCSVEVALSYLRRLTQGYLDILDFYIEKRESGEPIDSSTLVATLVRLIADRSQRPSPPVRLSVLLAPNLVDLNTEVSDVDLVMSGYEIADLHSMSLDELYAFRSKLQRAERRFSTDRRALHQRIDRLEAELIKRYKSGETTVEELIG